MSIISKETWDNLIPAHEKEKIRGNYKWLINLPGTDTNSGGILALESLFGKEQLQPQPLTYEAVARELFFEKKGFYIASDSRIDEMTFDQQYKVWLQTNNCTSRKQAEKLLAINKLLNVARFLNGKDWKPNWENMNPDDKVWSLGIDEGMIRAYYVDKYGAIAEIVFFKTKTLAVQAVTILGEDAVRLALGDY